MNATLVASQHDYPPALWGSVGGGHNEAKHIDEANEAHILNRKSRHPEVVHCSAVDIRPCYPDDEGIEQMKGDSNGEVVAQHVFNHEKASLRLQNPTDFQKPGNGIGDRAEHAG